MNYVIQPEPPNGTVCYRCYQEPDGQDADERDLCDDCAYGLGLIFCDRCETYKPMAIDDIDADCLDCMIGAADRMRDMARER